MNKHHPSVLKLLYLLLPNSWMRRDGEKMIPDNFLCDAYVFMDLYHIISQLLAFFSLKWWHLLECTHLHKDGSQK